MAEKIEIEKPIVSKELAEAFEHIKNDDDMFLIDICDIDNYRDGIPEIEGLRAEDLEKLLAKMFVAGYEVEKSKKYVLKLPLYDDNHFGIPYLCKAPNGKYVYRFIDDECWFNYYDGFTKSEIEADEGLNKLASVCELIEVDD